MGALEERVVRWLVEGGGVIVGEGFFAPGMDLAKDVKRCLLAVRAA